MTFLLAVVAAGSLALAGCSDSGSGDGDGDGGARPQRSGAAPKESAATSPAPEGSGAPSPAVTGSVSGGVHRGDLRYFLLPLPEGAEPYGEPAGDPAGAADAAIGLGSVTEDSLRQRGFRQGALRVFRTADGSGEVNVKLLRFGSAGQARDFAGEDLFEGPAVSLPGESGTRATRLESSAAESTDALVAVGQEGDVAFTITVTGAGEPSAARMAELVADQRERLRTGR
ncbi:hypothetical protein GCM10027168_09400 [Streptomyces capparidis]